MVKKRPVIFFVGNRVEANVADNYIRKHRINNFLFLTSNIEASCYLLRHNFSHGDFYQVEFQQKDYYSLLENEYRKALEIAIDVRKKLYQSVTVFGQPLFDILQTHLETEFADVFHAYNLFQRIEKRWRPQSYYFPESLTTRLSGWSPDFFSPAAIIKDYFIPESKKQFFPVRSQNISTAWMKIQQKLHLLISHLVKTSGRNNNIPPQKSVGGVDFLFFSGGMNLLYYQDLFPLLQTQYRGVIVSSSRGYKDDQMLSEANIIFSPLKSFFSLALEKKIAQEIEKVKAETSFLFETDRLESFLPNDGDTRLKQALARKVQLVFTAHLPKATQAIALADKALNDFSPKLVITTHDPGPSALPFVLKARRQKIKTLFLMHGLHESVYGTKYESDYGIIWGKKMRTWYSQNFGKKAQRIFVGGFPYIDSLMKKRFASRRPQNDSIRLPVKIGVLLAYYPPTRGEAKFLSDLFYETRQMRDAFRFSLRSHPGQRLDGATELARLFGIHLVIDQKKSIADFVASHDIFISWDTTAIIWPMLQHKIVFLTPPWWGNGQLPLHRYNPLWVPKNPKKLFWTILEAARNPGRMRTLRAGQDEFLRDYVGRVSGDAAEEHARIIGKLIQEY